MRAEVSVFLRYGMSSYLGFETNYWYHLQGVADQAVGSTLKIGTKSVSEMSENLQILTQLSA